MTMQAPRSDADRALDAGRPGSPAAVDLSAAASLFHGLSDPTRLMILQHLTLGEHRVRDLTEHLGLAQSTVSAHLACLRDCGLVTSRPVGRASLFSLATEPQLLTMLRSAETLLAATGYAVTLCPNYGIGAAELDEPVAHPTSGSDG